MSQRAHAPRTLPVFLALVLVLSGMGVVGWKHSERLERRLGELESARHHLQSDLQHEVEGLQGELSSLRAAVADGVEPLGGRLEQTEQRIADVSARLASHRSTLEQLERAREAFGPEALETKLAVRDAQLSRLDGMLSSTRRSAEESRVRLDELATPDLGVRWRGLVGPVVQLAGDTSVGSGVLLKSKPAGERGFETPLLTAWHVVRDIQGDLSRTDEPVPVTIYAEDGSIQHELAELLAFEVDLDVALLRLFTDEALANGATLASRERIDSIKIFDEIYAVGCPLGNDPIPTRGEVATRTHEIDGEAYWMINAPTYIGNSGGGIFHSSTHELLGIFSKIYTHGSLRPTIVPHMGLATPLDAVYEWLELEGYAAVIEENGAEQAVPASSGN